MLITNIIQDSFQEFQDHISLVLFSFGCNFNCRGCYNYNYVTDINNIIGEANEIVDEHITPLHDAVVFLGGEPTIWREDLISAVSHVKDIGLKAKVFTNGFLPNVIDWLNKYKLVDAYSVDLKTVRNVYETVSVKMNDEEYLCKLDLSLKNILKVEIPVEIRTTRLGNVDIEEVQEYVENKYPSIKHIIQEDFVKNPIRHK